MIFLLVLSTLKSPVFRFKIIQKIRNANGRLKCRRITWSRFAHVAFRWIDLLMIVYRGLRLKYFQVDMVWMDLEPDPTGCKFDVLKIHDQGRDETLETYCGSKVYFPIISKAWKQTLLRAVKNSV